MDNALLALILAAALYLAGAVLAVTLPARFGFLATTISAVLAGGFGVVTGLILIIGRLTAGQPVPSSGQVLIRANLYELHPLGTLQIRADALSGFFLILIGTLSIGIALYSWGYMRPYSVRTLRVYGALTHLLLLSLLGIVVAGDLALFLIAWETMAITSYLLTNLEYQDRRIADAGFLMLAMSQVGTGAFLIGFLLLGTAAHGLGFDRMHAIAGSLSGGVRGAAFLLLFFGFGVKAGIIPLQVWQPPAYRAAPDNVSALLAAILVNMGIYGVIRFAVEMLGVGPAWWGFVVVGIGAISAVLGILYALSERDLKRFLAYSSVENIGIILIGVGASMVFASTHLRLLAALALVAALAHTLNHATSKGLLFLGTGSIDWATGGVRNMDRMGGLLRLLPWTAAFFLIGSLSIAAIPPFNGFISEWLTLEALLQSFHVPDLATKIGLAIAGAFLSLTAGLAVTAFVKAYGISFLGIARSEQTAQARRVPASMRWGMAIVAAEALVLGILPTAFIPWFSHVAAGIYGPNIANDVVPPVYAHPGQYPLLIHLGGALFRPIIPAPGPIVIPAYASFAAASPTYLAISFMIGVGILWGIRWWLGRVRSARQAEVWAGGIDHFTPNYQYTASSFANPIRIIFGMIYRPGREAETQFQDSQYFRISVTYRGYVVPIFERYLYPALTGSIMRVSAAAKVMQSGSINLYLAYIFAILIIVLLVVR